MAFFTLVDQEFLDTKNTDQNNPTYTLRSLHKMLQSPIRSHNLRLHAYLDSSAALGFESDTTDISAISYFRPEVEASLVEHLMGRETQEGSYTGDASRHPVIELRLTENHFVIELVLSPDAWWDQQNLVGKLCVKRHRNTFYKLIHEMDDNFRLGFWSGTELSDIHVRTGELAWTRALDEWMATFEEGRDWFRVGYWYDVNDPNLDEEAIVAEVFSRIKALYKVYEFFLWTGNNNFHNIYKSQNKQAVYA